MDSSIYGVPLSTEQVGPSNNVISGIRARLTVDESDFSYSSGGSYYSGSEIEGSESGEYTLETARVVEEDDGVVEETAFVNEFAVSEGDVVGLNGEVIVGSSSNDREFVQESGSVSGNGVFRPFARIPSGRIYGGVGNFVDSDDSGSLLSDSDDEKYVANNSRVVMDEEAPEEELTPATIIRVLSTRKLSIPVAKVSGDSDDDSRGSEVLDDDGFSGIARVPSVEVLRRVNSAINSRMSEGDEGDENKLEAEYAMEVELAGNLLDSGIVFSPLDEKEPIMVVQNNGLDFSEETISNSMAMNNEFNPTSELGQDRDLVCLGEEIKEVDAVDNWTECFELADHREHAKFVELSNMSEASLVDESEVSELGGSSNNSVEASLCNADAKSSNESDQTVDSFYKTSPAERSCDVLELSEALKESMPIHMSNGSAEDASSTIAIGVGKSVSEGSDLEVETGKEAETSDLLLPSEVEQSSFHSDYKAVIAEMDIMQDSTTPHTLLDHSQLIDGQFFEDSHDEANIDGGISSDRHITDLPPLAVPCNEIKSAVSDYDVVKFVSDDDVKFVSGDDVVKFVSVAARNSSNLDPCSTIGELNEGLIDSEKEKIMKIRRIVVEYLGLLERLGHSTQDYVASKVLNTLFLADGSSNSQALHLGSFTNAAMELESHPKDDLNLQLSVLIIGKTGVGKSATINSIFGETAAAVDAFEPSTKCVKEIKGSINGIKLKIFDTPGLRTSFLDQSINVKILSSIKKVMKKSPPDVILYVDRLDTQIGEMNDLPLLRLVTSCLGSSIWKKSIVVFTHGASVPPDECPFSYESFVAQQSYAIQRLISHSCMEQVAKSSGLIPLSVIVNDQFTEKSGDGERWSSELLLLCCSIKILSGMSSLVMSKSLLDLGSSFLQSNVHQELSDNQSGEILGSEASVSSRYRILEPSSWLLTRPVFNYVMSDPKVESCVAISGVIQPQDDAAYGVSFDARRREKDEATNRDETSMGLSVVRWRDESTFGCNLHSQISLRRKYKVDIAAALDNRLRGQICVKMSSCDQLQIAAVALIPIARALFNKLFGHSTQ